MPLDDVVLNNIANWFLAFLIYSFAGWVFEVVVEFIAHHRFSNRGFTIGPFCPIYGVGALFMALLLGPIQNIFVIFCVALVGATILEYVTSFIMEKAFRARWWDYSHEAFNLNGRVCLKTSLSFGIMGTIIVCLVNPFLISLIEQIDPLLKVALASLLLGFLIADLIVSLWLMINFRLTVGLVSRDGTDEIAERVHEIIWGKGPLERRLAKAFPDYKPKRVIKKSAKRRQQSAQRTKKSTQSAPKSSRRTRKSARPTTQKAARKSAKNRR